jgi:hypothetical protein
MGEAVRITKTGTAEELAPKWFNRNDLSSDPGQGDAQILGVIGFGKIGQALGRKAHLAFGTDASSVYRIASRSTTQTFFTLRFADAGRNGCDLLRLRVHQSQRGGTALRDIGGAAQGGRRCVNPHHARRGVTPPHERDHLRAE